MTAPDRRRPLPALVAIGALTLLTALVWFRVLHRGAEASPSPTRSATPCPTPTASAPTVLPKPPLVTLIVLNSTTRTGLATNARKLLIADGFRIPAQATNDGTSYGGHGQVAGVAEIRFGPAERAAAALVGYYVPGAKMVQTDSSAPSVIVSLGTKYTSLPKASAVLASIRAAHVTLTSPAPTSAPTTTSTPTSTPGC